MSRKRPLAAFALGAALASLSFAAAAQAPRAHVHGQLRLEVAIEGPTVIIDMESPLDNLVGFEHAPKTEAEKKSAEDAIAQLRAADPLFRIDPSANCKLGPVTLRSAALGLGKPTTEAPEGHAELAATFAFNCTNAQATKFIDIGLFDAFKATRLIEARIAAPQGEFKRTLKRPATRLGWTR